MDAVRAVCYRCFKPEITCICAQLPQVPNRTEVIVLQHPRERLHPIGTARFARLGLSNASVRVAWNANDLETEAPDWLRPGTGLLYPSPHARDLETLPAAERPERLVVLDGTWSTAKTLYRQKHWLHSLPHYRLSPTEPGRYRIRREPQEDYLSTIEAIVSALQLLEPETPGCAELIRAFDGMIDAQLAHKALNTGSGRHKLRRRERHLHRLPHALVEDFERLVIVYGESARSPMVTGSNELAYFVAHAVARDERFACLILPRTGLPDDVHLIHMGLTREHFASSCSGAEFRSRWLAFLDGCTSPLLAAWNQHTLEQLATATGTEPGRVSLKSAYRAVYGAADGSLTDVVARQGLPLRDLGVLGRAAERLAGAVAVAEFLHRRSQGSPDTSDVQPSAAAAADDS